MKSNVYCISQTFDNYFSRAPGGVEAAFPCTSCLRLFFSFVLQI
jgi:hypothetical protein